MNIKTAIFSLLLLGTLCVQAHPQKDTSSKPIHIAKMIGYSLSAAVNTCIAGGLIYLDTQIAPNLKEDPKEGELLLHYGIVAAVSYGAFGLAWLAKYHAVNAWEEYKKAFSKELNREMEDIHEEA